MMKSDKLLNDVDNSKIYKAPHYLHAYITAKGDMAQVVLLHDWRLSINAVPNANKSEVMVVCSN